MRIYVKIHPKTSQNKIVKNSENEYEVWVTAPPVDNKANDMLIKVLAKYFNMPKSSLKIIGGKTAKTKIIDIL
ncbi:MAG TPA: DUF167 domain-containing protein [Candidatus Moranbacteria bacterium]|nr:DUF167 domain-containing protein [Candidatus Moranbacteria bacterium]